MCLEARNTMIIKAIKPEFLVAPRTGLCTRDEVTVTQKYVLPRIHSAHSGKLRSLLITCVQLWLMPKEQPVMNQRLFPKL